MSPRISVYVKPWMRKGSFLFSFFSLHLLKSGIRHFIAICELPASPCNLAPRKDVTVTERSWLQNKTESGIQFLPRKLPNAEGKVIKKKQGGANPPIFSFFCSVQALGRSDKPTHVGEESLTYSLHQFKR